MRFLIALLCFAALSLAATTPTWPESFSATVVERSDGNMTWFRWFYDYNLMMDRVDTSFEWNGEFVFVTAITYYQYGYQYVAYYHRDEATCLIYYINETIPYVDFTGYRHMGISLVNFEYCDWWVNKDSQGDFLQVWTEEYSGDLVRIDISDNQGDEATWTFFEMDVGTQDPAIFSLPDAVIGICTWAPQTSDYTSESEFTGESTDDKIN